MKCSWNILEVWFLKTQTFVLSVFRNDLDCFSCFGKVSPCCWLNPEEILFGTIVIQFKLNPREMGLLWRAGGGSQWVENPQEEQPGWGISAEGGQDHQISRREKKRPLPWTSPCSYPRPLFLPRVNRVFVIAFFCFCQRQNLTLQLSPQICGRPTSGGATTPKS